MTERASTAPASSTWRTGGSGGSFPRDADQQEDAALEVEELQPGDLITYADPGDRPTTSRSGSATGGSCTRRAETASGSSKRWSPSSSGPAGAS